ncbi:DNA-binding transcriptional MerR regulator [Enterococcus sp. PF1-24]|uniref:MerR family transcriptional regulator n=1 Tax=unclassified Enterococcus TaxID=2608891 RepID=UPI00247492D9|nr:MULTISPECIES: MerR family transcriptional regulator [unclassified Enterococcus]MDH6363755.1 DNA-binding transcriptional MerR regulator [Enterococcus sp. PFB1-1]MDH6400711.1 DNA-binding transcriptional MerR regulator [Enterococcus sp. PF1-24]
MLSIGEFSRICKVSTKTLRYYAKIGLITPAEVNQENGYRYYAIDQLERMLFINRLKNYQFSLEEIKDLLNTDKQQAEKLLIALEMKKATLAENISKLENKLQQLDADLSNLQHGQPFMNYLEKIPVQIVEAPTLTLLSVREMVKEEAFSQAYSQYFGELFEKIQREQLSIAAPPMVLFHSQEFSEAGLDTEFAIPVKETLPGTTRLFQPGKCLKTRLQGAYANLVDVYAKQRKYAEEAGYQSNGALYEVYVVDPSEVTCENELITEIYYPVKKQ